MTNKIKSGDKYKLKSQPEFLVKVDKTTNDYINFGIPGIFTQAMPISCFNGLFEEAKGCTEETQRAINKLINND
jgi:hypothetical protein